jgi:hypothetical protein
MGRRKHIPSSQLSIILVSGLLLLIPSLWMYYVSEDASLILFLGDDGFMTSLRRTLMEPIVRTESGGGLFRPMVMVVNLLDHTIWGLRPFGYHLTNGLFHSVNILLMFLVCRRLFVKGTTVSMLAVLIFAIHPIHANSVYWISGRTDIIACFFYLLSMLAATKYIEMKRLHQLGLMFLSTFLAMVSKEITVTLPLAHLWIYVYINGRKKGWRICFRDATLWRIAIADVLVVLGFLGIRWWLFEAPFDVGSIYNIQGLNHYATNIVKAVAFLIVPFGHELLEQFFYTHRGPILISAVVGTGVLVYLFRREIRLRSPVIWLVGLTVLTMLPLLRLTMRWYLYLPSVPFSMLLAYGLVQVFTYRRWPLAGLMISYLVLLGFGLGIQTQIWLSNARMNRNLVESLIPHIEGHLKQEFLILNFPVKVYRTATFVSGFEETVSLLTGLPTARIDRLIRTAHAGKYSPCSIEWSDGGFTVRSRHKSSYLDLFDPEHLFGLKQWRVGDEHARQEGKIRVLEVTEAGFARAVRFDFHPEVLHPGMNLLLFDGEEYIPVPRSAWSGIPERE